MLDNTRERLALRAHDAWSGWMRYLFTFGTQNADGSFTIDAHQVSRWHRQMTTHYDELPEREKESDRKEADQILAIVAEGAEMPTLPALLRVARAAQELQTLKDERPADYDERKSKAWTALRAALAALTTTTTPTNGDEKA